MFFDYSDLNFDGELNQIPYVTKEQIKFTKFLGSGAFGEVFEGLAHNLIPDKSPVKVAVKVNVKQNFIHLKLTNFVFLNIFVFFYRL